MNRYVIKVGDWSADGHRQCEDFFVSSPEPLEKLKRLLAETEERIGLKVEELHGGFMERGVNSERGAIMKKHGFLPEDFDPKDPDFDPNDYFVPEYLPEMIVKMIKMADPSVEIQLEQEPEVLIRGIGYGLFD